MTLPSRRAILGTAAGFMLSGAKAWAVPDEPLAGAALYRDVVTYDRMGPHRTGGPGGRRTEAWLTERFMALGLSPARQEVPVTLHDPAGCHLTAGGNKIDLFPVWPAHWTDGSGLTAPLRPADGPPETMNGAIALVRLAFNRAASLPVPGLAEQIGRPISQGAAGVICVTEGPFGELIALNVPASQPAWKVPVLQAPGRAGASLAEFAAQGMAVTLVAAGRSGPGKGANVTGQSGGAGQAVVISTSHSGWFHCAGERGPGLALLLGLGAHLMRDGGSALKGRQLVLVSSAGHELMGVGGKLFVERLAPKPEQTDLWLHLGAGIATYKFTPGPGGPRTTGQANPDRFMGVTPKLLPLAASAMAGVSGLDQPFDASARPSAGEITLFLRAGYQRCAGLFAGHDFHHTPADRADKTGPDLLAPVARGLARFIDAALST